MAFVVTEFNMSRESTISFNSQRATVILKGRGTYDDTVARVGFLTVLPNPFMGLWFRDLTTSPLGGPVWEATAEYDSTVPELRSAPLPAAGASPPPPPPPGPADNQKLGPEYSWDITGETEHIVKSIATLNRKGIDKNGAALLPAAVPNYKRAIAVTGKGDVQGVDRISPKATISVTKLFDYITLEYYKKVAKLVGSVNSATFYNFARGDVLFLGASGQPRDNGGKVAVTFKFAHSPTLTDVEIFPGVTFATKRGWEYVWVAFRNKEDGTMTQEPWFASLEQIYEERDFAQLGIG